MQGYIFYPLRGILFGFSNDFSHLHAPSPSLPSLPDRARSTDSQPQAVRFLISLNFGAYLAVGTLEIPFDGKVYPLGWGNSLIFSLSVGLFIYQSARGVYYTNHLCSKSVLALRAQVSTQFVKCFCQEFILKHLLQRPGNFLHSRKFLCFFLCVGKPCTF